jgi:hypothetical protein
VPSSQPTSPRPTPITTTAGGMVLSVRLDLGGAMEMRLIA